MSMARAIVLIFLLLFFSCQNIADVEPENRNTLIHFYGGLGNFEGKGIEITNDGYLIIGDSLGSNTGIARRIVVIKTDFQGNPVWRKSFPDGSAGGLKVINDGIIVIGDKIEIDPNAEQLIDQVKRMLWIIKLDNNGGMVNSRTFGTFSALASERKDIRGFAITESGTGSIYSSGTIRLPGTRAQAFVAEHNSLTLDTVWSKRYDLDSRDYVNGKSVHVTQQNDIIWATSATLDQANVSRSYLSIPVLNPNSTFDNNQVFGREEETSLSYYGSDIQPSPNGFGVIGTYKSLTGTNANIYFLQTDPLGNILPGSDHYYDGASETLKIDAASKGNSVSDDEGSALIATTDGGFLIGGSSTTTTNKGNGGKDILLMKIDFLGNIIWNKIFGGSGDEYVSAIRNTADGGYVLCGTLDLAGQKQMLIMKIDKNGNLNN